MSYKEDLSIDKYKLDYEWEKQASKFIEWAEKAVDALFERDKAKDFLELTRAQLDSEIRKDVGEGKKLTEAAIQSQILQNERYISANDLYLEAVKNAKILDIAREAFDHKKKALEKITDLWIAGYWSIPKINKELKESVESDIGQNHKETLQENVRLRRRRDGTT